MQDLFEQLLGKVCVVLLAEKSNQKQQQKCVYLWDSALGFREFFAFIMYLGLKRIFM